MLQRVEKMYKTGTGATIAVGSASGHVEQGDKNADLLTQSYPDGSPKYRVTADGIVRKIVYRTTGSGRRIASTPQGSKSP